MSSRLFGTDGVRGVANVDITPELALGLARSAGSRIDGVAVIGRDTRRSGPMIASALHAGFNSVGVDTVDLGIIPVGAVSRLTRDAGARYGVMVSASHNPAPDNGIKFFGRDGSKLDDEAEGEIEYGLRDRHEFATGHLIGLQTVMSDAVDRYVSFLLHKSQYALRGVEIAVDCANGAASVAAPRAFEALKADVEVFAADPDGTNINDGCGATHPQALAGLAKGRIGLAFDGDADRLIAIDEEGGIVNGDVLMAIIATHLKETGKLAGNTVVATVMSNLGFHHAMKRAGIEVVQTQVGDRYVLEAMRERKAVLGGEQSGHIVLEDRTTGDGLLSAIRLLDIVAATGKSLAELRSVMTEFPQVLTNVRVARKDGLSDAAEVWSAVADAEQDLGDAGRVLVRASGTEPLVRVMVEAEDEATASSVASSLATVVVGALGEAP